MEAPLSQHEVPHSRWKAGIRSGGVTRRVRAFYGGDVSAATRDETPTHPARPTPQQKRHEHTTERENGRGDIGSACDVRVRADGGSLLRPSLVPDDLAMAASSGQPPRNGSGSYRASVKTACELQTP